MGRPHGEVLSAGLLGRPSGEALLGSPLGTPWELPGNSWEPLEPLGLCMVLY